MPEAVLPSMPLIHDSGLPRASFKCCMDQISVSIKWPLLLSLVKPHGVQLVGCGGVCYLWRRVLMFSATCFLACRRPEASLNEC